MKHLWSLASDHSCGLACTPSLELWSILHSCCWIHWSAITLLFALLTSPTHPFFPFSFSCLPSARRELKVCWSRPLAPRSYPPRVLRGNPRQLIPAQTTAQRWTLTPPRSSPRAVEPVIPPAREAIPLHHVTPRVGRRKVNERLCIFPTLLTMPLFPLPLQTLAPNPKPGATKVPASPLCTDWLEWRLSQVETHLVWSLHAVTQSGTSDMNSKLSCLLVFWKSKALFMRMTITGMFNCVTDLQGKQEYESWLEDYSVEDVTQPLLFNEKHMARWDL